MNTAHTWVSHNIHLNYANTLARKFTHILCYLSSYPSIDRGWTRLSWQISFARWQKVDVLLKDHAYMSTFSLPDPQKEFWLVAPDQSRCQPSNPLVLPDHSMDHFLHISATFKFILKNEAVIPIQVLVITKSDTTQPSVKSTDKSHVMLHFYVRS